MYVGGVVGVDDEHVEVAIEVDVLDFDDVVQVVEFLELVADELGEGVVVDVLREEDDEVGGDAEAVEDEVLDLVLLEDVVEVDEEGGLRALEAELVGAEEVDVRLGLPLLDSLPEGLVVGDEEHVGLGLEQLASEGIA